jgi:hypothetical protein
VLKPEEEDVIKIISNLLNLVYELQAVAELRKKQENPDSFQSAKLFEHVLLLLQVYRFRPKGRKFIWNQFETLIFGNGLEKQSYYQL